MSNKTEAYNSNILDDILSEINPVEQEKTDKRMMLAARIDKARKAKHWTKKQLAEALGKQPSEITKWLSGTHNFTSDTLFDLERVLGATFIQLAERKQPKVVNYTATLQVVIHPGELTKAQQNPLGCEFFPLTKSNQVTASC